MFPSSRSYMPPLTLLISLEGVTIWDLALDPTGAFRLRPVDVTLEAVGVNPWDVVVDPTKALWPRECEGSPPVGGADASSESIGSASSADVDVPGPVGEEPDGDSEPPFLLEEPSGRPKYVFMHYSPLQGIYT